MLPRPRGPPLRANAEAYIPPKERYAPPTVPPSSSTPQIGSQSAAFSRLMSRDLAGHKKGVVSVCWNVSGKKLASGSHDQSVRVWPLSPTGHLSKDLELRGHSGYVNQVGWHPSDENVLASASDDKTVRLWDGRSNRCHNEIKTPGGNIYMRWHPNGQILAVSNKDEKLAFIDYRKNEIIREWDADDTLNEFCFDNAGELLFLSLGRSVDVMKYPSMERLSALHGHTAAMYSIQTDHHNKYIACGSFDNLVSMWDMEEFICLRTIDRMQQPTHALSFSHDDTMLACGSSELFIEICSVADGEELYRINTKGKVQSLTWHPSANILAYASDYADRYRRPGELRVFGYDPASASVQEMSKD